MDSGEGRGAVHRGGHWSKVRCAKPSGQRDKAHGAWVKGRLRAQGQARLPTFGPARRCVSGCQEGPAR